MNGRSLIHGVCQFAVHARAGSGRCLAAKLKPRLPTSLSVLALLSLLGCVTSPAPDAPPGDRELSRASSLARVAFERDSTARAARLYERGLKRARAMDDAVEIGTVAYNLALCQVIVGELDQAGASLVEARAAFQRAGSIPADLLMLEATLAQRQGLEEQSLALADQVISSSPDESHRVQAWVLKGVIACEHRDTVRAQAALAEAAKHRVTHPALLAAKHQLNGNILLLEENPAAAAAAFDRATASFREARRYRDMALALGRAGHAYREAGDEVRAADRLLRAGRSLAAQGENAK